MLPGNHLGARGGHEHCSCFMLMLVPGLVMVRIMTRDWACTDAKEHNRHQGARIPKKMSIASARSQVAGQRTRCYLPPATCHL